jgi:hypothetical protein
MAVRSIARPNNGGATFRPVRRIVRARPRVAVGRSVRRQGRSFNSVGRSPAGAIAPRATTTNPVSPTISAPIPTRQSFAIGTNPAPQSPHSSSARIGAEEMFRAEEANLNGEIYQAALRYGDPATLAQFKNFGPVVQNPNSELEEISRRETEGIRNVGLRENQGNTYFSSLRLGGQQRVADESSRARAASYANFQEAYSKYTRALIESRRRRDEVIRDSEAEDIERSENEPVEPIGGSEPISSPPVASNPSNPAPKTKSPAVGWGTVPPSGLGTRIFNAGRAQQARRSAPRAATRSGGAAAPRASVRRKRK